MPLPLGLELPGEPSVPEMTAIAQRAEALGYDSIWLTETRFTRDAITTTAAVAAATRHVRVATAVINPFARGAVLTAVTAATLDEAAGGRFILGLGPGSPTVLARQGLGFERPLERLRETMDRFVEVVIAAVSLNHLGTEQPPPLARAALKGYLAFFGAVLDEARATSTPPERILPILNETLAAALATADRDGA